jgi:hypothetical protein
VLEASNWGLQRLQPGRMGFMAHQQAWAHQWILKCNSPGWHSVLLLL